MSSDSTEPVYYFVGRAWYKGKEPWFYEPERQPAAEILRRCYPEIRREIEERFAVEGSYKNAAQPNYTPYSYREPGWRTINLYSYFLRYRNNCERFPTIDRITRAIPGVCLVQIGVLAPRTRLKAHFGDTSALIRHHLGIRVPASLPDVGIQVGREKRAWNEGEVFAIQIAHRHYAWNDTDEHRIVLIVDTIRPELMNQRYAIAARALSAIAMKAVATRFPPLKRVPGWLAKITHEALALAFRVRLAFERGFRATEPRSPDGYPRGRGLVS